MKTLDDLLLLGDPRLYQISQPVLMEELDLVKEWVSDLDSVMSQFRKRYHFGRAIAAPQIGIMKRLVYLNIDRPLIFINPQIEDPSLEMFEVWDDCMCFPQLFVRVERHKTLKIRYQDIDWKENILSAEGDLSELLQHEYDHLDGILCTMRAIDDKSYKWRK